MNTSDPLTEQLKASIDFENYKRISQGSVDALALEIVELQKRVRRIASVLAEAKYALENSNDQFEHIEQFCGVERLASTEDVMVINNRTLSSIRESLK